MINNVNKHPVSQLLDPESNLTYHIPKYQREYRWSTWQWEDLFDDLTENDLGYFLGSIICINSTTDTLKELEFEVIDGQQRLTTLSLFLAAIYSTLKNQREFLDDEQKADLLQIKRKLVLKQSDDKIKVVPQTQNNNLDDYRALLSELKLISKKEVPKNAGNRRIFKAYYYFKKRIEDLIEEAENKIILLFELVNKISSAVIVMIEVSTHSDAYTLFESLNNRGTPLTAVDLIKNLLLAKLDNVDGGRIDYHFEKWTQILNYLGDDYTVQERFFRHNYNAFRKEMNEPFKKEKRQYPLGRLANKANLLNIYEKVITHNPHKTIEALLDNASIYSTLLLRNQAEGDDELAETYLDLDRIQGTPSYLLLLFLIKNKDKYKINLEDSLKINRLLISYFVRRNLTDIPATRDLTRIFMSLVEEIEENRISGGKIFELIKLRLIENAADDSVFLNRLYGPVYDDNASATRFILCSIAKKGMTRENNLDLWKYNNSKQFVWTIEHILPQGKNIPESWIEMIAEGDECLAKEHQSNFVHTLGNLTITGYNSTLSNRSFIDKKERKDNQGNNIGYKNGLNLNADLVDRDSWTIEAIKERTEKLANQTVEMFKLG